MKTVLPIQRIKQARRESVLLREVTLLMRELALDEPSLDGFFVSKVELSPDGGVCFIYLYTPKGLAHFDEVLETLKLYRPSMRKSLAQRTKARHTPELIFKFDDHFEKQARLEQILESVKEEFKTYKNE